MIWRLTMGRGAYAGVMPAAAALTTVRAASYAAHHCSLQVQLQLFDAGVALMLGAAHGILHGLGPANNSAAYLLSRHLEAAQALLELTVSGPPDAECELCAAATEAFRVTPTITWLMHLTAQLAARPTDPAGEGRGGASSACACTGPAAPLHSQLCVPELLGQLSPCVSGAHCTPNPPLRRHSSPAVWSDLSRYTFVCKQLFHGEPVPGAHELPADVLAREPGACKSLARSMPRCRSLWLLITLISPEIETDLEPSHRLCMLLHLAQSIWILARFKQKSAQRGQLPSHASCCSTPCTQQCRPWRAACWRQRWQRRQEGAVVASQQARQSQRQNRT